MKAVISSTYSNQYLYFLPIVTFCWNKLGVDVICFIPDWQEDDSFTNKGHDKLILIDKTCMEQSLNLETYRFKSPKHKEATYAQCSRLYAGGLDLDNNEILMTSDIDMAVFKIPPYENNGFSITGVDLVPEKQFPICYIAAKKYLWEFIMNRGAKSYQDCLDNLLGNIECESFRGNYWGKDQETAHLHISTSPIDIHKFNRSNGQNQFAQHRYDRDDAYLLERLSPDTIDFHMNRPGYEDKNFEIILTVLQFHYPSENFQWLIDYTNQYKALL